MVRKICRSEDNKDVHNYIWVCVCVCLHVAFLLATQLNNLADENLLVPNCVCKVKKTITNTLADGRYVFSFLFPPGLSPSSYLFSTRNPFWPYFYLSCVLGLW